MAVRNRPRASLMKEDIADEQNLWYSIVDKIKTCGAVNKRYEDIAANIPAAEEKLSEIDPKDSVSQLEELERLHREGLKLAEEELKILNEEPDDLIKNLETLISVRAAFETDLPRLNTNNKSRNLKRRLDADSVIDSPVATPDTATPAAGPRLFNKATSRSGSVAAPSIKSESGGDQLEGMKSVAPEKPGRFGLQSDVFFKNKDKKSDGEGILCKITRIIGEGKQRRYEIQDPEPDENNEQPPPYRASVASLVAIPPRNTILPDLPKGKQVLALYPNTTTFYKAEVVGMKKGFCRLKFEGEDEKDKEQDVERHFVLTEWK